MNDRNHVRRRKVKQAGSLMSGSKNTQRAPAYSLHLQNFDFDFPAEHYLRWAERVRERFPKIFPGVKGWRNQWTMEARTF
jgi:hypothetical protein